MASGKGQTGRKSDRKSGNAKGLPIKPSDDWQCGKSLTESLNHLLTSGVEADVSFVIGEEKEIVHAHKLILIFRSPVFYAMFNGPMSEKGEVTIPDFNKETFSVFLKYLYTDQLELQVCNAISVLAVARKYMVDRLVTECESFIQSKMSATTSCTFLEEAHVYMEENVKAKCLDFIQKNPSSCLRSDAFSKLCHSCIENITSSDDLCAQESYVFEAVTNWSVVECGRKDLEATDGNKRKVLGSVLYNVRFPLMSEQYFNKTVLPSNLLSPEEMIMVYRLWHSKKSVKECKFNSDKRASYNKYTCCGMFNFSCNYCCQVTTSDFSCGHNSFLCNNCEISTVQCTHCSNWKQGVCSFCGTEYDGSDDNCYNCSATLICDYCGFS